MAYVRDDVAAVLALLAQAPGPKLHEVDPPTARGMMAMMGSMMEKPAPELHRREDFTLPGPAGDLRARLYQSGTSTADAPVLTFFHGGGWVIGDLDSHDQLCAEIALQSGFTVIAVDYRLGPEAPFPGAPQDAIAAVRWIAQSPAIIGHAVSGQILAGDSAGGNLAAVVARELVTEVKLLAQWLIYPGTDMTAHGGSFDEFADGYLLGRDSMIWFARHYAADPAHRWASPLHASEWDGLPPALVFVCGLDPLRDQGRAYAARLVQTGHRTIFREAAGQIHGCMNLRLAIPSAQQDLLDQIADLKALLA